MNIFKSKKKVEQQQQPVRKNMDESAEDFMKRSERGDGRITKITCTDIRMFYDSTWEVCFELNGVPGSVTIVRYDHESLEGLCNALDKLEVFNKESIRTLDKRDVIFYD